jgi:nitrile hydratase
MKKEQTDSANHAPASDDADKRGYYPRMQAAVEALLILKGIISAEDVEREVAAMAGRDYRRGAAMVARAWVDAGYRKRLLDDGAAAAKEVGFDLGQLRLTIVENTPLTHHVIVCTLCSCYPRALLGIPPGWYKSREYRSRVVREPRKVLSEFGTTVPEQVSILVHDSTADLRYMVLPMRPAGTAGLDEAALAGLVTRNSLIGVGLAKNPD